MKVYLVYRQPWGGTLWLDGIYKTLEKAKLRQQCLINKRQKLSPYKVTKWDFPIQYRRLR